MDLVSRNITLKNCLGNNGERDFGDGMISLFIEFCDFHGSLKI